MCSRARSRRLGAPWELSKPAQEASKFSEPANIYLFSMLWGSLGALRVEFFEIFNRFSVYPSSFSNCFCNKCINFSQIFRSEIHNARCFGIYCRPSNRSEHIVKKCHTKLPNVKCLGLRCQVGLGGCDDFLMIF